MSPLTQGLNYRSACDYLVDVSDLVNRGLGPTSKPSKKEGNVLSRL